MTSNAVQRPQTSGALRVAAAWARLRCSALHPGPRRSQPGGQDFHHGLLVGFALRLFHRCRPEDVGLNARATFSMFS